MAAVEIEIRESIAIVTLNRPERLNAMDPEMAVRLIDAYEQIRSSDDVRVAVMTGAGDRAFCAGGDLDATIPLMTGARAPATEWERRWLEVRGSGGPFKTDVGKPLISAVNGHAIAGGMELVMNSDIRIAVPEAKFGIPEVKVGLFPGGGSSVRLPNQIPYARALELLLTGDTITAAQALEYGFLNYVVPASGLMEKALEIATRIAANGPLAVRAVRDSVRACRGLPEAEALAIEAEFSARVHRTEDAVEGPRAFLEKRSPVFKGR
ncbi:MAG TPA: enoyl-CoA hydratase-related protein [Steroidobacter sp.]|uniref:enoyl-CoA hydratase/isomerase family protein n=1 Tax=Steroidobacter sp. TaxID=1978227 RepID=UPI002EDB1E7F